MMFFGFGKVTDDSGFVRLTGRHWPSQWHVRGCSIVRPITLESEVCNDPTYFQDYDNIAEKFQCHQPRIEMERGFAACSSRMINIKRSGGSRWLSPATQSLFLINKHDSQPGHPALSKSLIRVEGSPRGPTLLFSQFAPTRGWQGQACHIQSDTTCLVSWSSPI